MAPERKFRRRRKLIEPRLQIWLVATFLLLGAISTLLQAVNLIHELNSSTLAGPGGWTDEAPQLVVENLIFGFVVCVPLIAIVGIFVTFRLVGPLYRFRVYLQDLAANGYSGPCRIRQDDELQELCTALNAAVDRLRQSPAGASSTTSSATSDAAPAAPLPAGEAAATKAA